MHYCVSLCSQPALEISNLDLEAVSIPGLGVKVHLKGLGLGSGLGLGL